MLISYGYWLLADSFPRVKSTVTIVTNKSVRENAGLTMLDMLLFSRQRRYCANERNRGDGGPLYGSLGLHLPPPPSRPCLPPSVLIPAKTSQPAEGVRGHGVITSKVLAVAQPRSQ